MEKNVELGRLTFHRNILSIKLLNIENHCRRHVFGARKATKLKSYGRFLNLENLQKTAK